MLGVSNHILNPIFALVSPSWLGGLPWFPWHEGNLAQKPVQG